MNILEWIQSNKSWLFDGAAVVIPLSIIGWIVAKRSNFKAPKSSSKTQKSGRNSTNIQADRDVTITLSEVQKNEFNDTKSRR